MTPRVLVIIKASNLLVAIISLKDGTRSSGNTRVRHSGKEDSLLTSKVVRTELDKIQWGMSHHDPKLMYP